MMDQKSDFRVHMELAMDTGQPIGDCLGEGDLLAHARGETDAPAREPTESHLVRCERCRQRFLEFKDFFGPLREGEERPAEFAPARDWTLLSQRIRLHERTARTIIFPQKRPWRPRMLAFAASLLLTFGLVGGWTLRNLRDKTAFEASLGRAADENRRLQQRTETMQEQLAELQRPEVNSPILDVYPTQALARSPGARANQVEIPANTPVTLILNGQGQRRATGYSIAVLDRQGRQLWQANRLTRAADGNFSIILHSGFLADGEYRFRIFGKTSTGSEPIGEYVVSLHTSSAHGGNAR
jgi:hypothetical protein